MSPVTASLGQLAAAYKRFAHRLFTIGENRLELLLLEVREEREHSLHELLLSLGVAACGFLALLALNIALVIWLWAWSPVGVLLALAVVYAVAAALLYGRLARARRDWKMLSGTLDQLQKDRECLEKNLP